MINKYCPMIVAITSLYKYLYLGPSWLFPMPFLYTFLKEQILILQLTYELQKIIKHNKKIISIMQLLPPLTSFNHGKSDIHFESNPEHLPFPTFLDFFLAGLTFSLPTFSLTPIAHTCPLATVLTATIVGKRASFVLFFLS